jgi:hypothetical protein
MKNFNLSEFVAKVTIDYYKDNLSQRYGQRYGQYLYNQFRKNYPDVVIPDEVDCFYDCKKVGDFITFIGSL